MAATQEITLSVPEISCEHCVHTINTALGALPGISDVSTDIPTKTVHFTYDPSQAPMEKIIETLDEEGYTVVR